MTGDTGLRIGVLGPLSVSRDGVAVGLPRGRPRVLLAVLAMSVGRPVSGSRLGELIWDHDQPEHLRASLHTVAARLRGLLPGVVETAADGYLLNTDQDRVDLLRFRRLVREATAAGDPVSAVGLLDEALALWRGEPLADLRATALDRDVVPGLTDEYLTAVQQRGDLELAAGRTEQVVTELRELTSRHPLREPLWGQLMSALTAAGRPAEAIAEYHRAREILTAQLGVGPSPDLQAVYQRLLEAPAARPPGLAEEKSPSPAPRPTAASDPVRQADPGGGPRRRLPADTGMFTGRQAELMRLLELGEAAAGPHGAGPVVISVIDGMAGIGKTALTVHAAHLLAGRFGDGQLFIDLHGHTEGCPPRAAGEAQQALLRALGVPPGQIPDDAEERTGLYRQRLAGTRTLIVLDNAADEAQVRPLIPGEAGCLVLITSRRKLKSLDDAQVLALEVLSEPDAVALLRKVAGPGRAADERGAAEVAGLCGRLPLAVRIAGALLRNRPAWTLDYLAGKLRAAPTALDVFSDGSRDLAAIFGMSSRDLGDDQRRLYRLLGLVPGPSVEDYAVAALAGTDPATADRLLQDLVDHNLLLESAIGRYRMHDLVRAHARTQALGDPAGQREAALDRLLGYYQHTARRADALVARYARSGPGGSVPAHAPMLPDADAARGWLRAEHGNLAACLRYAIEGGLAERVVALSAGMANLLRTDGPWPVAIAAHSAAAAAAECAGDRPGQASALTELGSMQALTGDYPGAEASLRAALELHRETGDKSGQAYALTELAYLRRLTDDYPDAEASLRAALELHREAGDKPGQAYALAELGVARCASGDYRGAVASLRAALELHRETGDKPGQAHALNELIMVQTATGEYREAIRSGESALMLARELGDRLRVASALMETGMAQRLIGDYDSAARSQQAARDAFLELGNRLGYANALTELAEVSRLTGDHEGAARDLEESIGTYRDLDDRGSEAWALNYYAAATADGGDAARAIAIHHDALRLAREVHQSDDEAAALRGLGENHLRAGRVKDGAGYLRAALEIYQRLGLPAAEHISTRLAEIEADGPATPDSEQRARH